MTNLPYMLSALLCLPALNFAADEKPTGQATSQTASQATSQTVDQTPTTSQKPPYIPGNRSSFGAPGSQRSSFGAPRSILPSGATLIARLNKAHPRLLADAAQFEALRQKIATHPLLKRWHEALQQEGEQILSQPPGRYELPDGVRLLNTDERIVAIAQMLSGERPTAAALENAREMVTSE